MRPEPHPGSIRQYDVVASEAIEEVRPVSVGPALVKRELALYWLHEQRPVSRFPRLLFALRVARWLLFALLLSACTTVNRLEARFSGLCCDLGEYGALRCPLLEPRPPALARWRCFPGEAAEVQACDEPGGCRLGSLCSAPNDPRTGVVVACGERP